MKNKSKECNLICNYSLTEKEDYIRKYVNSKLKENYENETPFSYIKRDMPNMIKLIFLTFICGTVLFYFITMLLNEISMKLPKESLFKIITFIRRSNSSDMLVNGKDIHGHVIGGIHHIMILIVEVILYTKILLPMSGIKQLKKLILIIMVGKQTHGYGLFILNYIKFINLKNYKRRPAMKSQP